MYTVLLSNHELARHSRGMHEAHHVLHPEMLHTVSGTVPPTTIQVARDSGTQCGKELIQLASVAGTAGREQQNHGRIRSVQARPYRTGIDNSRNRLLGTGA